MSITKLLETPGISMPRRMKSRRASSQSSPHGVKYVIDGSLRTPAGGSIKMRTIWITDKDQVRPRFVTSYPV